MISTYFVFSPGINYTDAVITNAAFLYLPVRTGESSIKGKEREGSLFFFLYVPLGGLQGGDLSQSVPAIMEEILITFWSVWALSDDVG